MITAQSDLKSTLELSLFFDTTQKLIREARDDRSESKLRRCQLRLDMWAFKELPRQCQDDLYEQYRKAHAVVTGTAAA